MRRLPRAHVRRSRGLTLAELGARVGRAPSALSLLENGRREPKLSLIEALASALSVPAEELLRHGRYDDAIAQFRQALTGLYEHDPNLMLGLAQAQFSKGDAGAARATLDQLIAENPQFRSPAGHLLYARALEAEGNTVRALEEYRIVAGSFPGAEAAVRYAQLLQAQGQREESQKVARELLQQARIAPGHYRRAQREWLEAAQKLA